MFGYRRLLKADAYVGRKTVAFVGPNEAGKSTILSALRLFASDDAVPASDATRSQRGQDLDPNRVIVKLSFTLDDEQRTLAKDLPIEADKLRHLTFTKLASGKRHYLFSPAPVLSPKVKGDLTKAWPTIRKVLEEALDQRGEDDEAKFDAVALEAIESFVDGKSKQPDGAVWDQVNAGVAEHLEHDQKHAARVRSWRTHYDWARPGVNLHTLVYRGIGATMPVFLPFTENLRSIRAEYQLSDTAIDADPALANLLRLAQLPLDQIRAALAEPSHLRTLKDKANERLKTFFTEKWKQEQITVGIEISDDFLRIDVKDLVDGSPGWIAITDRSDGLRTFVALAAFLESGSHERPPILLIDEAEQHLHQNAQGDLIRMLQDLTEIGQVMYTTHSPACLPADLGNGVRFVEPIGEGHSVIRHDFWSLDRNEHVGFSPLLIVMGAGAAAFSSLRRALVAEGVSDMLLLPTLIKLATGKAELDYQVSPGIATASNTDMARVDFVASRVAYLVDGDPGGQIWKGDLLESGVPRTRIRSLPDGVGLEDLLDRGFYLDAIAELGGIERSRLGAAAEDRPVKASVGALGVTIKVPGPVAFAEFILGRHESREVPIVLAADKKKFLKDLDAWVLKTIVY